MMMVVAQEEIGVFQTEWRITVPGLWKFRGEVREWIEANNMRVGILPHSVPMTYNGIPQTAIYHRLHFNTVAEAALFKLRWEERRG